MKLKKEYLNIDIKEICLKNTNEMYNNNISEEWLNNFEKNIKVIYYNNYIEIYIALYLIAEQCKKEKINLCIIGKWNGILDNNYITYPLLIARNENYINIKVKYIELKEEQVILESDNIGLIINWLNEYCFDWEDIFMILCQ